MCSSVAIKNKQKYSLGVFKEGLKVLPMLGMNVFWSPKLTWQRFIEDLSLESTQVPQQFTPNLAHFIPEF